MTDALNESRDASDARLGPWRSALYPEDWTPEFTAPGGEFLHDFSYAGAFNGEAPLPPAPTARFDVNDYGADPLGALDSTAAFQLAIDAAQSMGGGTVVIPSGLFRIDGELRIRASNVVLQGDGPEASRIFFTRVEGMTGRAHVLFAGSGSEGVSTSLVRDVDARAREILVEDASGLTVGDEVAIGFVITDDFVERHGMTGTWVAFNGEYKHFYRRQVVAVDLDTSPHRLTLDVPLRDDVLVSDRAEVRELSGLIERVGIQDVGLSNAVAEDDAWNVALVHAVRMDWVVDSWIQRVRSFASPAGERDAHLMSGGIKILESHRVTVRDSVLQLAQNRGPNGNGYLFEVSKSNEVLFADNEGRGGRHNFIQNWDFGTSGVVWLRCSSFDGRSYSARGSISVLGLCDFHHSLATANLVDSNVAGDGWSVANRGASSSGAGLTGHENVFWHHQGGVLRTHQYGLGYVIGTEDVEVHTEIGDLIPASYQSEPEDYVEGLELGPSLEPPSLYEDQLSRRLTGR